MSNSSSRKTDLPLKVGITGGIGSGKTVVCRAFSILGIPVFNADRAAKELYTSHPRVRKEMVRLFGEEVFLPDGAINRSTLASLIFSDPGALEAVNALIHPLVREAFGEWHRQQEAPYLLFESALLFETGSWKTMDATLLVTAPRELRIQRVMERDRVTREAVIARMNNQWDDDRKKEENTIIIVNDDKIPLLEQILITDKNLRTYGKFR